MAGANSVTFKGALPQTIGGASSTTFDRLIVSTSGGAAVTLATDGAVNANLSLSGGRLILGANTLTLGVAAVIGGSPNTNRMVVADGAGSLCKLYTSSDTAPFNFPIGDMTGTANYSPATLNFTSGAFDTGAKACLRVTNAVQPNVDIFNYPSTSPATGRPHRPASPAFPVSHLPVRSDRRGGRQRPVGSGAGLLEVRQRRQSAMVGLQLPRIRSTNSSRAPSPASPTIPATRGHPWPLTWPPSPWMRPPTA